jgi:uncharacterized protein (TIGR03083 family)
MVVGMEIAEHITAIGREARLLAEAARIGGLDADVPSCPGWDMRALLSHLSMIHLWAAGHVAELHPGSWGDLESLSEFWPGLAAFWPDDEELVDWYLEVNDNLVRTLESAPVDKERWTFYGAPSTLAMWARRQAHETAIHRFDAENTAGIATEFDSTLASDGIDEMFTRMAPRYKGFPETQTMSVHATDTDDRWHLTITPNELTTIRVDRPADLTLSGNASDLYLAVWNRGDDSNITIGGDRDVLDQWRDDKKSRWPGEERST